jgi:RimJ/RimL family protein N-acetyltransferase
VKLCPITPERVQELKELAMVALTDDMVGTLVVNENGTVLASVVLGNFTSNSCWVHVAVLNPMAHRNDFLMEEISRFTFQDRGLTMLLTTTSSLNEGSLALQKRYGFQELVRIPNAISDGEDLVISRLLREDYVGRRSH